MTLKTYNFDQYEQTNKLERDSQAYGITEDGKSARRVIIGDITDQAASEISNLKNAPLITNYLISDTNEHSHVFQANTKAFAIKCRTAARMNLSWVINTTNSNYWTNGLGGIYREEGIKLPLNSTIYFRLDVANRVVEIIEWT